MAQMSHIYHENHSTWLGDSQNWHSTTVWSLSWDNGLQYLVKCIGQKVTVHFTSKRHLKMVIHVDPSDPKPTMHVANPK